MVTEADIAFSSNSFDLTTGTNTSRTNQAHFLTLARNWEARFLAVGVTIGGSACAAAIAIDPKGSGAEVVKRGTIRGTSVSAALGALAWTGRVPISRDGNVFFMVRNDTGATVTVRYLGSGIFLEDR